MVGKVNDSNSNKEIVYIFYSYIYQEEISFQLLI